MQAQLASSARSCSVQADVSFDSVSPQDGPVDELLFLPGQHLLGTLYALPQAVLELGISLSLSDVLRNCGTDDLSNRLVVDRRHGLQLFSLLSGQANGHGFDWLHTYIVAPKHRNCQVARHRGIVVAERRHT